METKAYIIVGVIIGLIIGSGIGYYAAPPKVEVEEVTVEVPIHQLKGEILFGLMASSVSNLEEEEPTAKIALDEVNEYAANMGLDVEFKLLVECAESSATKALEKIQNLNARGVNFIFGCRWSSHCQGALEYVNEHKIIIFNDGSTAPALRISGDYLYRLAPDDSNQGKALARMLIDCGIEALMLLNKADVYGDGLAEAITENFENLGGVVYWHSRYDPAKTEFSAEVESMNLAVKEAIDEYGADKVGIECVVDEPHISAIMAAAADYPALMSVKWFGNDSYIKSDRLREEQGDNALKTRHMCTYVSMIAPGIYDNFKDKFTPIMGRIPGPWPTNLYDTIWITAKAILEASTTDTEVIWEILPKVAAAHYGASGWCVLNEAGDRAAFQYIIWALLTNEEIMEYGLLKEHVEELDVDWAVIGTYDSVSDKIEWLVPKPLPQAT